MSNTSAVPRATRRVYALLVALLVAAFTLVGAAPAFAALAPPALVPGAPDGANDYTEYNGLIYLTAIQPGVGGQWVVYTYDGATFAELPGTPVGVSNLEVFDGKLLIVAIDDIANPPYENVFYSFDGTTVSPLTHTFNSPGDLVQSNGVLYFTAFTAGIRSVWSYDGTAFTQILGAYEGPYSPSIFAGKVYFTADNDPDFLNENYVLFVYDPAAPAAAIAVPGSPANPSTITTFNGLGYLGTATQLYSFDGITFTNIPALAPAVDPYQFVVFGGQLYIEAYDGSDYRLYVYSGGTITPVPGGFTESNEFVEFDGSLYFPGYEPTAPVGSLKVLTNGVAAPVPGSLAYPYSLAAINGSLYFTAYVEDEAFPQMFVIALAAVTPAPALAVTGSDTGMLALLALVLLSLGALVLAHTAMRRA